MASDFIHIYFPLVFFISASASACLNMASDFIHIYFPLVFFISASASACLNMASDFIHIYFPLVFFISASASACLARLARIPINLALDRATLIVLNALLAFSSSVITRALLTGLDATIGIIGPWSWAATERSASSLSPCLGLLCFLGNTISLLLYSFKRCTFDWSDSVDLFFLLWSTAIPIVLAYLIPIPAALSSSRVNPRPARTLVLYLKVGHLTTGLSGPATGLGAMSVAFFCLATLLLFLRPGWSCHVRTYSCQCLPKCWLGKMLLCFIFTDRRGPGSHNFERKFL